MNLLIGMKRIVLVDKFKMSRNCIKDDIKYTLGNLLYTISSNATDTGLKMKHFSRGDKKTAKRPPSTNLLWWHLHSVKKLKFTATN